MQIGHQYRAQADGVLGLSPEYIAKLYNMTDEAIRGEDSALYPCERLILHPGGLSPQEIKGRLTSMAWGLHFLT